MTDHQSLPPLDRFVRVRTAGGHRFIASRRNVGLPDCDWSWVAAPDQAPPDCWDDGVCWENNSRAVRSDPVISWSEI